MDDVFIHIEIRKASPVDIPAMAKIIADNFDYAMPEHSLAIREKFKSHCSAEILESQLAWKRVFVVCINASVVGTGAMENFGTLEQPKWSVSNFFIAVEHHGKGYGAKLLRHIISVIRKENVMELHVPSSLTAIEFYRKFGFKENAVQMPEDVANEITWMTYSNGPRFYVTSRLMLKEIAKSQAGLVLDYYLRNKTFLQDWDSIKDEEFYTQNYQENQLDKYDPESSLKLWIFPKDDENRIIGLLAFNNIVKGAFLSCHLGYKLDKDEINKGYITEAIHKGIEIAFNEFGLHRIEANVMPKNKRSLRVLEKLGFKDEGMAYKYLKINGKWEDHIHMVLLNDHV